MYIAVGSARRPAAPVSSELPSPTGAMRSRRRSAGVYSLRLAFAAVAAIAVAILISSSNHRTADAQGQWMRRLGRRIGGECRAAFFAALCCTYTISTHFAFSVSAEAALTAAEGCCLTPSFTATLSRSQ